MSEGKIYIHFINLSRYDFEYLGNLISKDINRWMLQKKLMGQIVFQRFEEKPNLEHRETTEGDLGVSFVLEMRSNIQPIVDELYNLACIYKIDCVIGYHEPTKDRDISLFGYTEGMPNIQEILSILVGFH